MWSTSKLLEVNLSETLMTNEQTRVFWEGVEDGSNFACLEVGGMNLEHVNISALAKVASQVYKLGLDNTSITPEH